MTYKLNKTDGTEIVSLNDGEVDTSSTDITLIGRNYKGFGEAINENFIKLLENFANSSSPSNPITGQLWYDTTESRLKIFDEGTNTWRTGAGPIIASSEPTLVAGDIWFNNSSNQLWFYDGSDTVLIGPGYTVNQGQSGFTTDTIIDSRGTARVITSLHVANQLIGIYSKEEFTPAYSIPGFSGVIYPGFNSSTLANAKYRGTATDADALNGIVAANFLRSDVNDTTIGSLRVQNNSGITIGSGDNITIGVDNANVTRIVNNRTESDLAIIVRDSSSEYNAIYIDSANQKIGMFTDAPSYNLDVAGDVRITGNLIVDGASTTINSTTLEVEDKNIVVANVDSPDNTTADTAGIIIKGATDKSILYNAANDTLKSSDSIELASGKSFYINSNLVLSATTLGAGITSSSLTSLGTLSSLTVDDVTINGTTISSTSVLNINTDGAITLNNQRIAGVQNPSQLQDVATKDYVDTSIAGAGLALSLDITDYPFTTSKNNGPIQDYIEDLVPAEDVFVNTQARIHAITYSSPPKRELRIYRVEESLGVKSWQHVSTSLYT